MLRYICDRDREVAAWIAEHIPHARGRGLAGGFRSIGIWQDGVGPIAGMAFHNWDPEAGTMHITAAAITPRWLTRETIRIMGQFPFVQCRCQMVEQHQPADNEHLLAQLVRAGYDLIWRPRMYGRNRDGVIATLTYEQWVSSPICQSFRRRAREQQEAA